MYRITQKLLNYKDYHRYEISNYARDGYECRHNIGYWERDTYLGLGLGAATLLRDETWGKKDVRYHHISDREEYLKICHHKKG